MENQISTLRADVDKGGDEVGQLLKELGNPAKGIPFYAIFPGDGGEPIVFIGAPFITQGQVLKALQKATPSFDDGETVTAMNAQASN